MTAPVNNGHPVLRPSKRLRVVTFRLTDPEEANLDALKMALGMDGSAVVRLALDRLAASFGPLSKVSDRHSDRLLES
jgi:hypothetical protein